MCDLKVGDLVELVAHRNTFCPPQYIGLRLIITDGPKFVDHETPDRNPFYKVSGAPPALLQFIGRYCEIVDYFTHLCLRRIDPPAFEVQAIQFEELHA